MFLADKYHALLPSSHSDNSRRRRGKAVSSTFDAALAARLRGLVPLPASPLAALARLADLLAITLRDAVLALSVAAEDDDASVAAHLDAGIALLDACNTIAARIDRLRRRRLLSRFAVHLLSSSSSSSSITRARSALADRAASTPAPLPCLLPFDDDNNKQRLTATARVLVAVNAVSSLAGAAAASILGELEKATTFPLLISGDFPWAEPFNAVSSHLSGLSTREVDAVDKAVENLASVLDSDDEAAVRAAARQVEDLTEELTARLDRLSDAVNGVFRAALCLRNAELGSFMAAGKTRRK